MSLINCAKVEDRLTKPRMPRANGMVDGFRRLIADVVRTHQITSGDDLEQTLIRDVAITNSN